MPTPDFDTVRRLSIRAKDGMYPAQADEAEDELSGILPEELDDALRGLDPRSDEFERVFDEFYEKAKTTAVAQAKAKPAKAKYKPHRATKSREQWRVLKNYPSYEISNKSRVRSLVRTKPDDWLKPRWFRGDQYVVLYDKDGARRELRVYWLMVAAGWLGAPKAKPKPV